MASKKVTIELDIDPVLYGRKDTNAEAIRLAEKILMTDIDYKNPNDTNFVMIRCGTSKSKVINVL